MANGKPNPAIAFIWTVFMGLVLHDVKATLQTKFMEDICYSDKTVRIDLRYFPTGILMSLPRTGLETEFDCEVILTPPRDSSVVVSIYKYDLSPNDTLTIEDSDRFKVALTGYGNFKDEKKAIISEGRMAIRYQRNSIDRYLHVRQGFQLTFTAAKHDGPCYDNEFQCNNRLCILKEYVCDGHNHCGDRSDQKACVPKDTRISNANQDIKVYRQDSHIIWISIIGVSGAIVFIIVIVFIVVVLRTRKPKAPPAPNTNNQNNGGNAPLQSVSSTVPQQQPHATTADTVPSAPPAPEGFSFYNRVRRSLRGMRNPKPEDVSNEIVNSEVYQVPSMYPNLDQQEPAASEGGIVNSEFKNDES